MHGPVVLPRQLAAPLRSTGQSVEADHDGLVWRGELVDRIPEVIDLVVTFVVGRQESRPLRLGVPASAGNITAQGPLHSTDDKRGKWNPKRGIKGIDRLAHGDHGTLKEVIPVERPMPNPLRHMVRETGIALDEVFSPPGRQRGPSVR